MIINLDVSGLNQQPLYKKKLILDVPTYMTPSLVLAAASSTPAFVFSAAATTPSLAMENPFFRTSILRTVQICEWPSAAAGCVL